MTYYDLLQVNSNASIEIIKASYKTMAKKYHPDICGDNGEMMSKINEAYEVLSDPDRRKQYDESIKETEPIEFTSASPQNNHISHAENKKIPVYKKSWFVILMLIIFFPVGLWLMWAYKKNWNIIVKVLITAFFAYCFIESIVSDSEPSNSDDTNMSSQSSYSDNIVTDKEDSVQTTLNAKLQNDVTTQTSLKVTTAEITTAIESLEIKTPDEFIYNDKLYSINNLTIDEVKNIFSDLTEMDETVFKNDDIGFMSDDSGNINAVCLFNGNGSFFKNITPEMNSGEIESILGGTSADEEGEVWFLDSEGNVVYDMDSTYYIQLMEDESLGTVLMLCRTDAAMEAEAEDTATLFIGYEGNDILPDLDNVTVYLDDIKLFTLQKGDVKVLLYNNDGRMHTLRIENTVAQYITDTSAEIKFRCLPVNSFYISSGIDDGYIISEIETYEFNELFPNISFNEDNLYVFTNDEVFSSEEYIDYCISNEIKSDIIDSIKEWF